MTKRNFTWKRLVGVILALTMLLTVTPVQAASSKIMDITCYYDTDTNTKTVYCYSTTKDKYANQTALMNFCEKSKKTLVKNLSSSDSSVARADITRTKLSAGEYYTVIGLVVKNPGTATISFEVESETYSIDVTVKKFNGSSVLNYIKIGNKKIKGSDFKSGRSYYLSYKKYLNKKVKLKIKLKEGWTVDHIFFTYSLASNGRETMGKSFKNPNRTLTLKYKKASTFSPYLCWTLSNKSTGETANLFVYFK